MPRRSLKVGAIKDISGEVNIAGGDIIKNIKTISQRALTAAEEAARARELESELLARGVAGLAQSLSAQASEGVDGGSPYKGLLSYNLNEAEIFCGRSEAKKDLLNCIKQGPLTVLHAESGAGKSSLLQAGIAAQLIANGHLAVYLRPHNADPVDFIKRMFMPELSQTLGLAQVSLREFLRQICSVVGPKANLYLLLDQFEEFFKLLKKDERRPFLEALAECLNDPSLRVRWVLSLRAEALSDLAELEAFGIAPFKNLYRLNRLSRAEAEDAMIEPARRCGITFKRALIDQILDTLTTHNEVMPTHLQLVCSALTDDLPEDKTLTLAYYTEYEGGTEGILRDYLKRQLEYLPATERALAWKMLRVLITSDRQRAVKTRDEIYQELRTGNASKEQVDAIIGRLAERRLLFSQLTATETFELAHDYLIQEIELDPQEQACKAAQELLDQETRAYKRHKTLLTAERLAVIEPYQHELRFSTDAAALLSESVNTVQKEKLARERFRNIALGISFAIAIVMTLLAVWGLRSSQAARQQAKIALARQLAAQAQSINATRSSKQMVAVLLATQSMKILPSGEAAQFLLNNNFSARSLTHVVHDDLVNSVAFSPDGKYVVSGSRDNTARVWEVATGKEVARMTHSNVVETVLFSLDGKYVISSGSRDNTVRVWKATSGKEIARMTHHDTVNSVALSPDGKYVVSGSSDFTARVWETVTGKEMARSTHKGEVFSVAISLDGKYVVSRSRDYTAHVWEAMTGKEVANITTHGTDSLLLSSPDGRYTISGNAWGTIRVQEVATGKEVIHMPILYPGAFSPDGKYVVSGYDRTVHVHEMATGKEVARMTHDGSVSSVAFSPDGKYAVSGSSDFTARVWEVATSKEITRMTHNGWVKSVAFSPDGKCVVSGSDDGTVRIWEATANKRVTLLMYAGDVHTIAFSPDGKYVMSGSSDAPARVWSALSGKEVARIPNDAPVNSIAFSPDGRYVVLRNGFAHIWELSTSKEIAFMNRADDEVLSAAFSPNGKYFASGTRNSMLRVWEIATDKEVTWLTHNGSGRSVAFSPDSKYVTSGDQDGIIHVWEIDTGDEVALMIHDDLVNSVAFSPDGQYVVSEGLNTICVWEAATSKEIARLHYGFVSSFAFSPDSKYIVSSSSDSPDSSGFATVWEVATGKEIVRLYHDSIVTSVAFNPDGKYVVSGSQDYTARVWETKTGEEIARVTHGDVVTSVAFSPNGKYVASGSEDTMVRIWMWQPSDLIANTCVYLPRNLTRTEWKQYIGDILPYQATCAALPIEPERSRININHAILVLLWTIALYIIGGWIAYRVVFSNVASSSPANASFTWRWFVIAGTQGGFLMTLVAFGFLIDIQFALETTPFIFFMLIPSGFWAGGAYSYFTRFQSGKLNRTKRIFLGSLSGLFGDFISCFLVIIIWAHIFVPDFSFREDWLAILLDSGIVGVAGGVISAVGALSYVFGIQKWAGKS